MPSPFPGMDPYLESPAFWPDFHATFINYWREALAELLPANYEARLGERVYLIEPEAGNKKLIGPDLSITHETGVKAASTSHSSVTMLEPVTLPLVMIDEPRETYIEILHRPERSLIAVLELLSPGNKSEPGRSVYLHKRNSLLYQQVHLVELDLLLSGQRLPFAKPLPPGDYYAFVARSGHRPNCEAYAWTIHHLLPPIPIPLKAPDPDIHVNLAAVFATAYERGRYSRSIDYSALPPVPLDSETQRWISEELH